MNHRTLGLLASILALPFLASCEADAPSSPTALDVAAAIAPEPVRVSVPDEHPNGPFYSMIGLNTIIGSLRLPHTDEYGAVPFVRALGCVPPDFNLLSPFDLTPAFPGGPPRPFLCASTVTGHLVFKDLGGPNQKLIQSQLHGDEVPIVFAEWSELAAAVADDVLTLDELLALPSAVVGTADHYKETVVTGSLTPGSVSFRIVARGTIPGGTFRFRYVDHGPGTAGPQSTHIVIN
ncbi:MAG: hypothetical protein ABFS34_16205 [Gemmatimonadota bacterium]